MLALAFDTASEATTAALARIDADGGVELIAEQSEVANNRHGELLTPMIAAVLAAADARPADLEQIVVGVGPGPFTGLRVGLVTAAAFGHSLGVGVVGVCSLDAVAFAVDRPAQRFAVLSDARRREVYWAEYADGRRLTSPAVDRPETLLSLPRYVVGAGAILHREQLPAGTVVDEAAAYPSAAAMLRLSADPYWLTSVRPMYLRRPDATPPGKPKTVTPV